MLFFTVYTGDDTLIDRNASLIVSRVPIANGKKFNKNEPKVEEHVSAFVEEKVPKLIKKVADNEEDRIKEMVSQSTKDYDVSKYAKGKGPIGPLRSSYICFRCGQGGHYIKNCPTNNVSYCLILLLNSILLQQISNFFFSNFFFSD